MALRRNPPPSDESRAELYDRTCGDTAPATRGGGRDKRPRSPDFIPEKRMKRDALRLASVDIKEIIKAHCMNHLAAADGAQTIAGLESALTAWVAAQCKRPLGQELSADEVARFSKEVKDAKNRELNDWSKFQVFSPLMWKRVTKDIADTPWVLTWKSAEGRRTVKSAAGGSGVSGP